MQIALTVATAVVVFVYLVAVIRRNLEVQFWALIVGIGTFFVGFIHDYITDESVWVQVMNFVIIAVWAWMAKEAYNELNKEKEEEVTDGS